MDREFHLMVFYNYRYDDDEKPSDFAADPFFREPYTSSYVPCSNPILHTDGLLYSGAYIGTAATGYLLVQRPPSLTAVVDRHGANLLPGPRSLISWNGKLYFACYDGSNPTTLYELSGTAARPNGLVLTLYDTTATAGVPQIISTRDRILTAFSGTSNVIRRQTKDGTAGNLVMPDTVFGISANASYKVMAEYKGKVYILGTDSTGATIYSVDGDTVAVARTGLTGTAYTLAVFNDYLYYLTGVNLGRFDGSSWTDAHDDITALSGEMLVVYKGNLLVFNGVQCHKSDGTDTTTWAATASTTATDAHPGQAPGEVFYVVY
jgi:hypothetical protein